jgi:hypothetical protein
LPRLGGKPDGECLCCGPGDDHVRGVAFRAKPVFDWQLIDRVRVCSRVG